MRTEFVLSNRWRDNRYSSQVTVFTVILYTIANVIFQLFVFPEQDLWLIKFVSGLVLLAVAVAVLSVYRTGIISCAVTAWFLPSVMVITQLIFAVYRGGEAVFFWYMLICSLICLSYHNKRSLIVYIVISNVTAIVSLYFLQWNILGENYTIGQHTTQYMAFNFGNILVYAICVFSIKNMQKNENSGRMYDAFLHTTPGYMAVVNERARVEYISDSLAERFGLSDAEYALNRPILDLCNTFEQKMMFQDTMEQGLKGSYIDKYIEKHYELVTDGRKEWFLMRSALILGEQARRIFEITDITPIMEAKNEAETASKSKSDFLANMSHEIRTPMNAIIGMTELLMLKPLNSDQLFQAMSIKAASMSLLKIINDILDFSKLDSQKMEIVNSPFDFGSLIHDTINMIGIRAHAEGLAFLVNISKDVPPVINGDELRLKQVLVNLLNNSVKFTKEGYVSVSAYSERFDDGSVKLYFAVEDSGMGIKREDIGKIFGEYEQLDVLKNKNITGTGLGLVISRRFIELMGGSINVESVYGKGSTFTFSIYCPPHNERTHEGSIAALPDPQKYRVLYYEPNRHHIRSLKLMFDDLGVRCVITRIEVEFEAEMRNGKFTHVFFDKAAEQRVIDYNGGKEENYYLVKEMTDVGSAHFPSHFINRPAFVAGIARILTGTGAHVQSDKNVEENKIKLGAFKVKNVRALVVDDYPPNLLVAEGLLRQYGISVKTVSGGREAIDAVQESDYDLIFMDHMMPDVDGIDATIAIRQLGGRFAKVPIIALSANAVKGAAEQFIAAGMDDFLSKPILIGELHRMLIKFIPEEKIR